MYAHIYIYIYICLCTRILKNMREYNLQKCLLACIRTHVTFMPSHMYSSGGRTNCVHKCVCVHIYINMNNIVYIYIYR